MKAIYLLIVIFVTACATQPPKQESSQFTEKSIAESIEQASALVKQGNPKKAIDLHLSSSNLACDNQYKNSKQRVYASRDLAETMAYMVIAAAKKQDAVAVGIVCADSYYLTSYAYIDLGNLKEAEHFLQKAADMAPFNSLYQSELGHIYQTKRQYEKALATFTQAESNAEDFSPEPVKQDELSRAKRGVGYNLIELDRLDEAEKKFKECLEINPKDSSALNELNYIKSLKKQ